MRLADDEDLRALPLPELSDRARDRLEAFRHEMIAAFANVPGEVPDGEGDDDELNEGGS